MCSLAVAEDIHTVVTPAPRVLKRNQFRAQRGCCKMCQGIPKLHQNTGRGDGGEQRPRLEQSCWARWHTGPCCSGHQQLPAQGKGTEKERSCFAGREEEEEEVHTVL